MRSLYSTNTLQHSNSSLCKEIANCNSERAMYVQYCMSVCERGAPEGVRRMLPLASRRRRRRPAEAEEKQRRARNPGTASCTTSRTLRAQ